MRKANSYKIYNRHEDLEINRKNNPIEIWAKAINR